MCGKGELEKAISLLCVVDEFFTYLLDYAIKNKIPLPKNADYFIAELENAWNYHHPPCNTQNEHHEDATEPYFITTA